MFAGILLPPAVSDGAFSRLLNLSTSEINCKFSTFLMACVCMPRLRSRQVSRFICYDDGNGDECKLR